MTTLGIALIVCGLTLVCGSMIFRLFTRRASSSSQESFEEGLERLDHYVRNAQRAPRDLDDKSTPAEHVPDDRDHRDQ
jgi:hypothetical protein